MTYPTHRQYAICFAFLTSMLVYKYSLSEINYYLALPIILMASKYGALFPDLDHIWQNVKEKTVPNWIINKLIHITGGKHRSWQTHSIDILAIFGAIGIIFPSILLEYNKISPVNKEVLDILVVGFFSGWASHLLADMMTSAGVRLFCWNKKLLIRLVPRHLGKLRFNTGNEWEGFVYKIVRVVNILLGLLCISFPLIPSILDGSLVEQLKYFIPIL